jgi:hypothetical protein
LEHMSKNENSGREKKKQENIKCNRSRQEHNSGFRLVPMTQDNLGAVWGLF